MSQHIFTTESYEILCGWDRPLQGFFLVVEKVTEDGKEPTDEDEYVYSNLDEPFYLAHPKQFDHFVKILNRLSIDIPSGLIQALEADKINNTGNDVTRWN